MGTDALSDIPMELISRGVVLAGEYAWPAEDAIRVIDHLVRANLGVTGVELWQDSEGYPRWIATSNYNCDEAAGWAAYVECSGAGAKSFVWRFTEEPGALFNLSWYHEAEMDSSQRSEHA
jgi:hypothetical protein